MKKFFIYVHWDEPTYQLCDTKMSPVYDGGEIELTEAEVADYTRVVAEYEAWQDKLSDVRNKNGCQDQKR
jgi:hypothetical protein